MLWFEVIVDNTKTLHAGRMLDKFSDIVTRRAGTLERFTRMLDCVDVTFLPDGILDELTPPPGSPRPCRGRWTPTNPAKPRTTDANCAVRTRSSNRAWAVATVCQARPRAPSPHY